MSRTVTALYDTRAEAEAARQRLSSAVDVNNARIIDQDSTGSGASGTGLNSVHLSHEDRHAYQEGIRRGGYLLCADVGGHEDADKIVRLLEESPGVDIDERQESWRNEGWTPYSETPRSGGFQPQALAGGTPGTTGGTTGAGATGNVVEEERVPIVEEELKIGKREVERGGARVRSFVREVPVHEQVTLREEHVSVERRPVNDTLRSADLDSGDLLQERTIEMTATAEEAVVAKEARVKEEVVVRKTAEERIEQVDDTVSRTEVDVDRDTGAQGDRPAFGGFGSDRTSSDQTTTGSDFERNTSR